jgi:hypothetical protein
MENPLTKHCRSAGETYTQHLMFAAGCGAKMVLGGLACIIHGLLPVCFSRTGSRTIFILYWRLKTGTRTRKGEMRYEKEMAVAQRV